ncbi:metallo-phosphohydrolase [Stenotrophomonas phage C121]|uniref:HNH endonuclease n=1 Tax=Stenotrophomonas phage C121 TaxID=2914029 RepID=UPI0023294D9A|nr:HNH endonuclease [Stenotrophomonas phage C121]UKL14776.1 metallo-phosphohydrolase [Stenotrophomonas phage C121]
MSRYRAVDPKEIEALGLMRELDKAKAEVFLTGKQTAFFGSIMCSLEFIWTRDVATAATDGLRIFWNPDFFKGKSTQTNAFVLLHELQHVARLHMIRRGSRDPDDWNIACDYRINNDQKHEGMTHAGVSPYFDKKFDQHPKLCEEDIYDLIHDPNKPKPIGGHWGAGEGDGPDMIPGNEEEVQQVVNNVIAAVQAAKAAGQHVDSSITDTLNKFLKPIIPWKPVLRQFLTDQMEYERSWARPNRRYSDIYLPGNIPDEGRLEHLLFVQDTSASILNEDSVRFNSELKYVWEELKPKLMTIAQFDTRIRHVEIREEGDRFDWVKIHGRGGTDLRCVRKLILEKKPTAAIIFSDLECEPMDTRGINCPLLWVVINNKQASVRKGKLLHI